MESDKKIEKIKVLVVEDMTLNQLLMKTILAGLGFEHDIAANGRIAIEKLKSQSYDIVLMDLQMPEMDGFETTEYIRGEMKLNIPIIALTSNTSTADVEKYSAAGMNDWIAKPADEKLLKEKIIQLLSSSEDINEK